MSLITVSAADSHLPQLEIFANILSNTLHTAAKRVKFSQNKKHEI